MLLTLLVSELDFQSCLTPIKSIKQAFNQKITTGGQQLAAKINQAVTDRHAADMDSDSWLSKSVRPVILVVMTLFTLGFISVVNPETVAEVEAYPTLGGQFQVA